MDTGLQWDTRAYLEDCKWKKWIGGTGCLLASVILALMIMFTPAHAAIDSVPPISGGSTQASGSVSMTNGYRPNGNMYAPVSPTPDAACKAIHLKYFAGLVNSTTWQCYTDLGYPYVWLDIVSVCPTNSKGTIACTCLKDFQPDSNAKNCVPVVTCPTPTTNPTIPYVLNTATGMCVRTLPDPVQCPAHSTGTPPACVCNAGFKFDAAKTSCIPKCTVLDEFPEFNATDKCSQSLENGAGKDVDMTCPDLDPEMVKQEQCLAQKIRRLGISYTEPSSTVRTVAYQQHFVDLWKWKKVKIPEAQKYWSDAEKLLCAPIVAKVETEWGKHKLDGLPSNGGPKAPHVLRKAIDINRDIVEAMMKNVSTSFDIKNPQCFFCGPVPFYVGNVEDYVNSSMINPPACKLRWGGLFKGKAYDPVHFDLLLK